MAHYLQKKRWYPIYPELPKNTWKYPGIPGNTQECPEITDSKKIAENTRSPIFFHSYPTEPNLRPSIFCNIHLARYWKTLPVGHCPRWISRGRFEDWRPRSENPKRNRGSNEKRPTKEGQPKEAATAVSTVWFDYSRKWATWEAH